MTLQVSERLHQLLAVDCPPEVLAVLESQVAKTLDLQLVPSNPIAAIKVGEVFKRKRKARGEGTGILLYKTHSMPYDASISQF